MRLNRSDILDTQLDGQNMDEITRDTEVLSLDGEQALAWFRDTQSGSQPVPVGFQWQSLAAGAALRARISSDAESLAWAELAFDVFSRLSEEKPNGDFGESAMHCVVAMMEKHGVVTGDRLRDPDVIFDWFRESQPEDYEGTLRLIQQLTAEMSEAFETSVVAPLRNTKSRLNVIRLVPDSCEAPADIQQYLKLWGELP